jgi:hypothetical protein
MKINAPFSASGAGFFFHYGYYDNVDMPNYTNLNTSFRGRTHVALGTDTSTQFKLGLSFNTNDPTGTTPDLNLGETYLVVVKYEFIDGTTNDQVSLYVFADGDDSTTEPASPTLGPFTGTASDAPVLQSIALRQYNSNQNITVDGIYVRAVWDLTHDFTNIIWNGTAWSNVTGPTINGEFIATENLSVKKLTVNAAASFTLNAGNSLLLAEELINNATEDDVVIESGAYLHQTAAVENTGSITIKRAANIKRLDIVLWSSPTAAQNLLALSPATLSNRFFNYNESANNWAIVADVANHNMEIGTGYGVRAPNDWTTTNSEYTASFKGVPNNGNYTFPLTSNHATANYNAIGNPYPSVLDLRAFYEENDTKIQNTFYLYEHSVAVGAVGQTNFGVLTIAADPANNVYVPASSSLYNATADVAAIEISESVEVGQGFFVRAIPEESGNLNFNNAMRKTTSSGVFFRNALSVNEITSKFRLELINPEGYANQTVIGYYNDAHEGLDRMDAVGLGSPLYTLLNNNKLASQGFGLPLNQGQMIPVGLSIGVAGTHTLALHSAQGIFETNQLIILKDNALGTYHNLSLSNYPFEIEAGVHNTRFEVLFTSVLSADNPSLINNAVIIFEMNDVLQAQIQGNSMLESIQVVDLSGKVIFNKSGLSTNLYAVTSLKKTETILLVTTKTVDGKIQTQKVFY